MDKKSLRARLAPTAVVGAGLAASAMLALSFSPTMSGLLASITNSENTAATGYLAMVETNGPGGTGDITCDSDPDNGANGPAVCADINKYGGETTIDPGDTVTRTISIRNTGTIDAESFSLTPGECTQSVLAGTPGAGAATDLCDRMNIRITAAGGPAGNVFDGSAADLADGGVINLAAVSAVGVMNPNDVVDFRFDVTLDEAADNAYEGLQISQPLTWTFTA